MHIVIQLTGTSDLIQHNIRLADPLNEYTRAIKKITSKHHSKKTDDDLAQIIRLEARGGCYETDDGLLGIPTEVVHACIKESAKTLKKSKTIDPGLIFDEIVEPLLIDGKEISCDDFIEDPAHIYYRGVGIGKNRIMRSRPKISAGWKSRHKFEVRSDVINLRDLEQHLSRAEKLVGICERRPRFGQFTATITETKQ